MYSRALIAVIALALALRLPRVALRWDEVALAYAAYAEPVMRTLSAGRLQEAAATWVGLHPPLHAVLMWLFEVLAPAPLCWLGLSAAFSLAAVALVGWRAGPVAALLLASAPLQVAYAAEVNNYPLAVMAVAALLAAARAPWPWLAAAAVLSGWSHVLGLAAAAGVVSWRIAGAPPELRDRGAALRLLAASALGLGPIFVGVLRRLGSESTWAQPEPGWGWLVDGASRVGLEGLIATAILLPALRAEALAAALPVALALAAALGLGAAAPHQFPYLLLLGPPIAMAARAARLRPLLVALCLIRAARLGAEEAEAVAVLRGDLAQERAADRAREASAPGATLWLVSPAIEPDDDKSAMSPVLWRFPPWLRAPVARPVSFEYSDPRYGQPRWMDGRVVHTSTELDPGAFDHVAGAALAGGQTLWVVLYDHGPAAGLAARVERVLRPYRATEISGVWEADRERELGPDRLWRVEGLR